MNKPVAYICDAIRTPIGRYGGVLSAIRTDDLGAIPIKSLMERNPQVQWVRWCMVMLIKPGKITAMLLG